MNAFRSRNLKPLSNEVNPNRTHELYALSGDGYIIAQDTACQHEYIAASTCPDCGGRFVVLAQINRAFQGLNEHVAACSSCRSQAAFIFDISNDVYQEWLSHELGDVYIRQFDGPGRNAAQCSPDIGR